MKRAIIYGLGKRYRLFKDELNELYDVVATADKGVLQNGESIYSFDSSAYDVIVIPGKKYYEEIMEELRGKGIDKEILGYETEYYNRELEMIRNNLPENRRRGSTSYSDMSSFPDFCMLASLDDNVFNSFKRSMIFTDTVEHSIYEDGKAALDMIMRQSPRFTDDQWDLFLKNDLYGNPRVYKYSRNGKTFSANPNTLIYIWELQEIVREFDAEYKNGQIKSVTEIGVGFGGLCRLVCSYWVDLKKYNLIDLPEVLALADKFLGMYDMDIVNTVDGTSDFEGINSDLVISNWAFSELTREVQEIYIKKVICNSDYGFMIWNPLSEQELDGMTMEEFMERVPNSRIIKNTLLGNMADIVLWCK